MRRKQLLLGIVLVTLGAAAAAAEKSKSVDSILDRLEKRLMDEERGVMDMGDEAGASMQKADEIITTYEGKGQVIQAVPQRSRPLADVEEAVDQLVRDVDQLGSDVQSHRQKILEAARIDNVVEILVAPDDAKKTSLRTIDVEIDGVNVYRISQDAGLWLTQKSIPVYLGPMKPGAHELSFTARVARKSGEKLTYDASGYGTVNQKFAFKIPDGKSKKRFVVKVAAPDKGNETGKAEWQELNKK